jgi:hypothetical protein
VYIFFASVFVSIIEDVPLLVGALYGVNAAYELPFWTRLNISTDPGPWFYFHGKLYPDYSNHPGKANHFRDYILSESIDYKTFEDTSGQRRSSVPAHWRGATKLSSGSQIRVIRGWSMRFPTR